MGDREIFRANFNRLLSSANKSQSDVAKALNISQTTVSTWFVGTRIPRLDKLEALADFFGVQKSELIEEQPVKDKLSRKQEILIKVIREAEPSAIDKLYQLAQVLFPDKLP